MPSVKWQSLYYKSLPPLAPCKTRKNIGSTKYTQILARRRIMPKRLGGSCGATIAGKTNRKRCKIKAVGDAARWRSSKSGGAGPTKTKQPLDKQYQSWGFVSLLEPPLEIRGGGAARRMTRRSTNRKSCSKFARIIIIVVATPLGCTWDTFMQRVCVCIGCGRGS